MQCAEQESAQGVPTKENIFLQGPCTLPKSMLIPNNDSWTSHDQKISNKAIKDTRYDMNLVQTGLSEDALNFLALINA